MKTALIFVIGVLCGQTIVGFIFGKQVKALADLLREILKERGEER